MTTFIYRKDTENLDSILTLLPSIIEGCEKYTLFSDSDNNLLAYNMMLEEMSGVSCGHESGALRGATEAGELCESRESREANGVRGACEACESGASGDGVSSNVSDDADDGDIVSGDVGSDVGSGARARVGDCICDCSISGHLVIASPASLGNTTTAISKHIKELLNTRFTISIVGFETTYVTTSIEANHTVLKTILDVYESLIEEQPLVIDRIAYSKGGRHKLSYPENWDSLYTKWKNKEITATEFRTLTGLKRGTFYNMITAYQHSQSSLREECDLA